MASRMLSALQCIGRGGLSFSKLRLQFARFSLPKVVKIILDILHISPRSFFTERAILTYLALFITHLHGILLIYDESPFFYRAYFHFWQRKESRDREHQGERSTALPSNLELLRAKLGYAFAVCNLKSRIEFTLIFYAPKYERYKEHSKDNE